MNDLTIDVIDKEIRLFRNFIEPLDATVNNNGKIHMRRCKSMDNLKHIKREVKDTTIDAIYVEILIIDKTAVNKHKEL